MCKVENILCGRVKQRWKQQRDNTENSTTLPSHILSSLLFFQFHYPYTPSYLPSAAQVFEFDTLVMVDIVVIVVCFTWKFANKFSMLLFQRSNVVWCAVCLCYFNFGERTLRFFMTTSWQRLSGILVGYFFSTMCPCTTCWLNIYLFMCLYCSQWLS